MSVHFPSEDKQRSSWVDVVAFFILAILGFYIVPGVLLVELLRSWLHASWDVGQMWTFSFAASFGIHIVLSVVRGGAFRGFRSYLGIGFLCAAAMLVAHFGLKASWPSQAYTAFVQDFFPTDSTAPASHHAAVTPEAPQPEQAAVSPERRIPVQASNSPYKAAEGGAKKAEVAELSGAEAQEALKDYSYRVSAVIAPEIQYPAQAADSPPC